MVDGLAEAHAPTHADAFRGNRVAIGVEVDIAFDVHAALVHVVDLRYVVRERSQGRLFSDPKGPGRCTQVFPKLEVGAITPGAELCVAVVDVFEGAPRIEVVLDVVKGPLDSSGAIRIPHRMRLEAEVESLGEGPHHGGRDGVPATTVGDDNGAVVDHAARSAPSEVLQGFAEKGAAFEAGPARIDLGVEKPAVAEDKTCALELALRVTQQNGMGGCVVLHLFSGLEVISPGRDAGLDTYPLPSAEVRQRGVGNREGVARLELLGHPNEVAATFFVERSDDLDVLIKSGPAMDRRDFGRAAFDNGAHGIAREAQGPRDRASPETHLMELENGLPHFLVMHGASPSALGDH